MFWHRNAQSFICSNRGRSLSWEVLRTGALVIASESQRIPKLFCRLGALARHSVASCANWSRSWKSPRRGPLACVVAHSEKCRSRARNASAETGMWEVWADGTPATRARYAHSQRSIQFHRLGLPERRPPGLLYVYYISMTERDFSVDTESSSVHVSNWMDRTTAKNAIVPPSPTICQKSR